MSIQFVMFAVATWQARLLSFNVSSVGLDSVSAVTVFNSRRIEKQARLAVDGDGVRGSRSLFGAKYFEAVLPGRREIK